MLNRMHYRIQARNEDFKFVAENCKPYGVDLPPAIDRVFSYNKERSIYESESMDRVIWFEKKFVEDNEKFFYKIPIEKFIERLIELQLNDLRYNLYKILCAYDVKLTKECSLNIDLTLKLNGKNLQQRSTHDIYQQEIDRLIFDSKDQSGRDFLGKLFKLY